MSDKLGPIGIEFVLDKKADEQAKKLKSNLDAVATAGEKVNKVMTKINGTVEKEVKSYKSLDEEMTAVFQGMMKAIKDGDMKTADSLEARLKEIRAQKDALSKETKSAKQGEVTENVTVEKSQGAIISSLGKWVTGLFATGAALEMAKKVIASSGAATDKLNQVIGGAKAGLEYFFKTIASGDWSNFLTSLDKAIKAGVEFEKVMSSIQNRRNEMLIKESEIDIQIGKLREDTYSKDDKNNVKRLESLDKINDLTRQKYNESIKLDTDTFNAAVSRTSATTKLSEEEIKSLLKEYSSLEAVIEMGTKYNENKKLIRNPDIGNDFRSQLQKENDAMGAGAERMGEYAIKVGKLTDEERANITKLWVAMNKGERAFNDETKRSATERAAVWNDMLQNWYKEIEENSKAAFEIGNEIKLLKIESAEIGSEAADKGMKKELQLIENKYKEDLVKFEDNEEAKTLLTQKYALEKLNIYKNYYSEMAKAAQELDPGKGYSILDRAITNSGGKPATGGELGPDGTFNQLKHTPITVLSQLEKDRQAEKEREDNLKKQFKLRQDIVRSATDLVFQLGKVAGLDEEQQQQVGMLLDTITRLAASDYLGAAVSMISQLMTLIPDQAAKFAGQMENLNGLLEKQQRLVDLSERKGGEGDARKKELELLQQQKAAIEAQIAKDQKIMGSWINLFGSKEKAQGDFFNQLQALDELQIKIDEKSQAYNDFLTGGITENTIADSIAQGFRDGKTSVDDFGNYMNTILMDAITNIFKKKLLDDPAMKTWMEEATIAFNDPTLTQEQKDKLKADYAALANKYEGWWKDATSGLTENDAGSDKSLSGAIKGVSEETASVLAGQVNAIRISQAESNGMVRQQLMHLANIDSNTSYCIYLKSIDEKLGAMKNDSLRSQGL